MTDDELAAAEWFDEAAQSDEGQAEYGRERGLPVSNVEQAARRERLAAHALRVRGMLVEALEVSCFFLDPSRGLESICRRCGESEAAHRPETCEVAAALAEARKTP
jgi:hypothetical protein